MLADSPDKHEEAPEGLAVEAAEAAEAQMVSAMRLVLATSALLTWVIDPLSFGEGKLVWLLFAAYVVHGLVLHVLTVLQKPVALGKLIHWLDVVWCVVFVALTGAISSLLFLFFFFAILTSAFRWGLEEGARVTLVSTFLFVLTAFLPSTEPDMSRLLLRSSFLLALGYISAYWGESKVVLNRRLALLRDVSQLSNPRFGVDHTVTRVLEKTCEFFSARSAVLVLRDKESGEYRMRLVRAGRQQQSVQAEGLDADVAAPLLSPSPAAVMLFARSRWPLQRWASLQSYSTQTSLWTQASDVGAGQTLADLLEGHAFITAPLSLRRTQGRIFVVTQKRHPGRSDALFLSHIVAQAFPVIENIELVDRMASDAALQERRKIAMDIHDRAVQPYIGLTLGLSAVRKKAEPGNPLIEDLDTLGDVARQAIEDLRRYAGTFRSTGGDKLEFTSVLLEQAAQVKALYGVDISLRADPDLCINDRMKAEVLQIVREGLSNICRHTQAQQGQLQLQRDKGWLHIHIDNAAGAQPAAEFSPRSISERVLALGGRLQVATSQEGATSVQIALPV
jgi:signal transduction histidine kinase